MLHSWPSAFGPGEGSPEAIWYDLVSPSEEEAATVAAMTGAKPPDRAELGAIEVSSRLRRQGGLLIMSSPTAARTEAEGRKSGHGPAPVGFMVSRERLVTVRFGDPPAFDTLTRKLAAGEASAASGLEMFALLAEEIVGHVADGLERLAEGINRLANATFHSDDEEGRHAVRANRLLRRRLREVGRFGDRLSAIRDGLQGLARVVAFTEDFAGEAPDDAAVQRRLASVHQDIAALADYDERLANKVQFTLDAIVGLIGIAQNDIFKVLTIVSIVGIPPTLMAGVYGMNFKNMPEYNWAWGYQWGWAVILLSALLPLAWFKWKGWF